MKQRFSEKTTSNNNSCNFCVRACVSCWKSEHARDAIRETWESRQVLTTPLWDTFHTKARFSMTLVSEIDTEWTLTGATRVRIPEPTPQRAQGEHYYTKKHEPFRKRFSSECWLDLEMINWTESPRFTFHVCLEDIDPIFKIFKNWWNRSQGLFGAGLLQFFDFWNYEMSTNDISRKWFWIWYWTILDNLAYPKSRIMVSGSHGHAH